MDIKFLLLGVFTFIIFILLITVGLIFILIDNSCSSCETCSYTGPIPIPLEDEVIGAASNLTLYSTKSVQGYTKPCFVYYGKGVNFELTDYGIKLPVGTYNVYVQYLATKAVDGEILSDELIKTSFIGQDNSIVSQSVVANKTDTFSDGKAMTEYDTVELSSNKNILRIESAIKGFTNQTLFVDRVEVLFEKVLL